MNIGIIGCGNIGVKRSQSIGSHTLKAVADIQLEKALHLASQHTGVLVFKNWKDLVKRPEVDIVIVCTTNEYLAEITRGAIEAGKHVLVEKPAGLNSHELEPLIGLSAQYQVRVHVGYNLRYHPSFIKAQYLLATEPLGDIILARGRYGHGGRIGYDKEWRASVGELMDQGVHLIDLSRWFLGSISKIYGSTHAYFWNMKDDNAFIHLENENGNIAWLHVSCTEWRNMFSFEIYCKHGKIQIDGLGGSYGTERVTLYQMHPSMSMPDTTIWEYPQPDRSMETEFLHFVDSIENGGGAFPDISDAYEILKIVEKINNGN
ncbi:MAG: Gfo/Idh/MocA family oxidoreductase [Pedobacter sp.]|uniref:Gfo/Idh/MocA family protein n=1 Tax=Pedobacter sp. TaxID=1411316 RepID=UPI0035642EAF